MYFKSTFLLPGLLSLFLLGFLACGDDVDPQEPLVESATEVDESSKSSVKGLHLIEPAEVKEMYDQGQAFKVIEISKKNKYEQGHLPGAINLWRPDYEGKGYSYGGMRASPDEMAALLGSLGISPDDQIVIYDTKGSVDAIRFMWMLNMYGHTRVVVMNGGKTAWELAGYVLTTDLAPAAETVAYTFPAEPDYTHLVGLSDVVAAMNDTNVILLDTREPEEYQGAPYISKGFCYPYKKGAFINGRIPGSIHLNWSDAVDLDGDHRFKSLKDLKYNFKKAGITPDRKIIAYCQSGVRSAHTTYVLTELLGYPDVRNYDGSWIEWSYYHVNGNKVPITQDMDEVEHKRRMATLEAELTATQKAME